MHQCLSHAAQIIHFEDTVPAILLQRPPLSLSLSLSRSTLFALTLSFIWCPHSHPNPNPQPPTPCLFAHTHWEGTSTVVYHECPVGKRRRPLLFGTALPTPPSDVAGVTMGLHFLSHVSEATCTTGRETVHHKGKGEDEQADFAQKTTTENIKR